MQEGRHEPGKRGRLHDHRPGHQDHEPRRLEDRHGVEAVRPVHPLCDAVLVPVRTGREPGNMIRDENQMTHPENRMRCFIYENPQHDTLFIEHMV